MADETGGEPGQERAAGRVATRRGERSDGRPPAAATVVAIGARDALDDAACCAIATLARSHGLRTKTLRPDALRGQDAAGHDISAAALVCLSVTGLRKDAEISEAAERLRARAPRARPMIGSWCAPDDASVETLRLAANADYAFRSFRDAAMAALDQAAARRPAGPVAVEALSRPDEGPHASNDAWSGRALALGPSKDGP